MTPERWQQLREIFRVAIECAPEERAAYLDDIGNGDVMLRAEIEALLASHDRAEHFIETPAFTGSSLGPISEAEQVAGRRVGPYELLREIGRGGMGTVYLARRADQQYEKLVAIKIVRRGLDTEDILRRFRNERQILAGLEHPNIARLLDGGTTDDGLPFLVMEYVDGTPLIEFCDRNSSSIDERLQIFRTICAAVQHAHQHLIVHRDLKPSNVLVTADGAPKLLDFGIAKVLTPESSGPSAENTRTELRVLTPDYASPEQVRGEKLATTSDVYSLGVMLYELLTGKRPYSITGSSPHEVARAICEQEPTKPSAVGSVDFSLRNRIESDLRPQTKVYATLCGDLDNIILMALRKEPERRYQSVAEFSGDIQRHRDGLPVIAHKPTFKYRAGKFVLRHRFGVAAAAIILLSLVGGIVATTWQARAARREKANTESINAFLERMINYSNPVMNSSQTSDHPTTVAEAVDEAARRLDAGEFNDRPEVKAELERIVGMSYDFQGRYDLAIKHLQAYVSIQKTLNSATHSKTLDALAVQASLLPFKGQTVEAEKIFREVLPLMRSELQKGDLKPENLAYALTSFAYLRRTQGDSKEAESLFRETLALSPQIPTESRYLVRLTRSTLASTIADQGRFNEALQTAQEAVDEFRHTGQTDTPDYGFALTVLGGFLAENGNLAAADACLHEAENLFRKLLHPSHLWLGDNLRNQAISLYNQDRFAEAQDKAREARKIYDDSAGPKYDHYPTVLITQGLILTKTGQAPEGEKLLREAVRLRTESLPIGHYWVALAISALGECLAIQKKYDEAELLLQQSYDSLRVSQGSDNPRTKLARQRLVNLYQRLGTPDKAARL